MHRSIELVEGSLAMCNYAYVREVIPLNLRREDFDFSKLLPKCQNCYNRVATFSTLPHKSFTLHAACQYPEGEYSIRNGLSNEHKLQSMRSLMSRLSKPPFSLASFLVLRKYFWM